MIHVTIIVPVYNMEKYLSQCLDSILCQTLKDIEIVCVDDGSTDRSPEILEGYRKRDHRIIVRTQENSGVSAARNAGIQEAQGDYIAFMDPDDYYPDSEVLNDLWNAAHQNNAFICGGSFSEDHGTWRKKQFDGEEARYHFDREGWMAYRDYQFDYGFHRFLYRRSFLLEKGLCFPPYIRFQDPPFFVRAMAEAGRFYALPRITYCYRAEHRTINWTDERVIALLRGLGDNLRISREKNLNELHCLTAWRLIFEYAEVISEHLYRENEEVLNLVFEAERLFDRDILREHNMEQGIQTIVQNSLRSCDKEKEEEYRSHYLKTIDAIYASWNYRVGAVVLYWPKKISRVLERMKYLKE